MQLSGYEIEFNNSIYLIKLQTERQWSQDDYSANAEFPSLSPFRFLSMLDEERCKRDKSQ